MRELKESPSAEAPSQRSTSLSFRITLFVTTKPGTELSQPRQTFATNNAADTVGTGVKSKCKNDMLAAASFQHKAHAAEVHGPSGAEIEIQGALRCKAVRETLQKVAGMHGHARRENFRATLELTLFCWASYSALH